MSYIIRQARLSGGATGCFGRPAHRPAGQANLVCPLCAHETGNATAKTARISVGKYIECESCGRHSAVMTEDGTALVPGVVAYVLLTGLESLPAVRHALVLDGHAAEGVAPTDAGAFADLKAALEGNGNLIELTKVDLTSPGPTTPHARFPVVRLGEATRRLAQLGRSASESRETHGVPDAMAHLLETV